MVRGRISRGLTESYTERLARPIPGELCGERLQRSLYWY
jgi:hypothetical protein